MSLLLLSEYKEILGITGSEEDEFVELAVNETEQTIKSFLNRDLEAKDYVEIYDGQSTNVLILDQFPINSISKIEYYDGLDPLDVEEWIEYVQGDDYDRLLNYESYITLDGIVFPEGYKNIRVTYNAGYTDIPADIQKAAKKLCLLYYGEVKKNKSLGKASVSEGSTFTKTTSYDLGAEDRILKSIEKYKAINA